MTASPVLAEPAATVRIRAATDADLSAVAAIMNDAVLNTTGSFDAEPKTVQEMRDRFAGDRARFPLLVAEADGTVLGWACIGRYSDRRAYADTGEVSIYVAPESKGTGVGTALMAALVAAGWAAGYHSLIARIGEGNPASLALHRRAGFTEAGFLKEVGFKFGRRLGIHILQAMRP